MRLFVNMSDLEARPSSKRGRKQGPVRKSTPDVTLRRFISDVGLPLRHAALLMEATPSAVLQWWSRGSGDLLQLGNKELSNLCKNLNISEDSLVEGSFDRSFVRRRIHEGPTTLPDHYSMRPGSHVRSSAHIIKYLTLTRGQDFCDRILSQLNVSPLIYEDLDRTINLKFFVDILNLLPKKGLDTLEMKSLPGLLFLSLMETPLGSEFGRVSSYYDCYLVLAKNIHLFDANFIYESDVDSKSYRLVADLPYDLYRAQGLELGELNSLFAYRERLPAWFAYLSGLAPVTPKVSYEFKSDVFRAVYEISFPNLRLMHRNHTWK